MVGGFDVSMYTSKVNVSPESTSLADHSNFMDPGLTVDSAFGLIKSAGNGE